jgi:hypothetical protein
MNVNAFLKQQKPFPNTAITKTIRTGKPKRLVQAMLSAVSANRKGYIPMAM